MRAVVVIALAVSVACRPSDPVRREACLRVASGSTDSAEYLFSRALAELFNERGFGVCATAEPTNGNTTNLKLLQEGSADFAIVRANELYAAYIDGSLIDPRPHSHLRGVAVVFPSVLHIMVRSDSPARTQADLKNTRVGIWVPGRGASPSVSYADLLAAAGEERPVETDLVRMRVTELGEALGSSAIAGAFINAAYPHEALTQLARGGAIRFLEFESGAAARIRARYPFFERAVIPAKTYPGQDQPISTIAVQNLLVVREGLDEQAVYLVTKTMLEDLPKLTEEHGFAALVDPDRAPATPIPLHGGASRYYRERELLQ